MLFAKIRCLAKEPPSKPTLDPQALGVGSHWLCAEASAPSIMSAALVLTCWGHRRHSELLSLPGDMVQEEPHSHPLPLYLVVFPRQQEVKKALGSYGNPLSAFLSLLLSLPYPTAPYLSCFVGITRSGSFLHLFDSCAIDSHVGCF